MKIDVRHLAGLAKIRVQDDEVQKFEADMRSMLEMMEDMPQPIDAVEELDEDNAMPLRPDVVQPSFSRDDLLRGAPEKNAGCFVVPKTV